MPRRGRSRPCRTRRRRRRGRGRSARGGVAGLLDGLEDEVEGLAVGAEVRGEAALVAESGGQALALQDLLQRVVDLGAPAQRLGEGLRADRGDHELLDVHVGVGVRAAVQDVHHRHRQQVRVRAAQVAEERQVAGLGGGVGDGEGDAEDGVGAEGACCRWRPGRTWPGRSGAARWRRSDQLRADLLDDGEDGLLHALALVAARVTVAQLDGLEAPVEAPDGTAARPVLPSSRPTSTSTVGLPRESRISRATTTSMDGTSISFLDVTLEVRGVVPYG